MKQFIVKRLDDNTLHNIGSSVFPSSNEFVVIQQVDNDLDGSLWELYQEENEFGDLVDKVRLKSDYQDTLSEIEDKKAWSKFRRERDSRLKETDYIMMPDYPLQDKSTWETYRQALRDLPDNTQDPNNPNWPQKPE